MNLQQLLDAVDSGKNAFHAEGSTISDIEAFQPLVSLILLAEREGYITGVDPRRESFTGRRLYYVVRVAGPTRLGRDRLDSPNH